MTAPTWVSEYADVLRQRIAVYDAMESQTRDGAGARNPEAYKAAREAAEQALGVLGERFGVSALPDRAYGRFSGMVHDALFEEARRVSDDVRVGERLLAYESKLRKRVQELQPRPLDASEGITTCVTTLSALQRLPEAHGELERFYGMFPELRPREALFGEQRSSAHTTPMD